MKCGQEVYIMQKVRVIIVLIIKITSTQLSIFNFLLFQFVHFLLGGGGGEGGGREGGGTRLKTYALHTSYIDLKKWTTFKLLT